MDIGSFSPIQPIGKEIITQKTTNQGTAFADWVKGAVESTMQDQKTAEGLTRALAGGENIPLQEVIQAVGKAETTLQTMVTMRDKAVEAYQTILRMPI